jgi:hypothetical protein
MSAARRPVLANGKSERRQGHRIPSRAYGKVTTPAVLEIEAAVPVAVSAALLIQAPPTSLIPFVTMFGLDFGALVGGRRC